MQPRLHGMLPVANSKFRKVQQSAVKWPASLKQCAALCNSLTLVNKGVLVGDAADLAAFKACEATFLVGLAAQSMQGTPTVQTNGLTYTVHACLKRTVHARSTHNHARLINNQMHARHTHKACTPLTFIVCCPDCAHALLSCRVGDIT